MKATSLPVLLLFLCLHQGYSDIKVPSKVFEVDQLEEAKAKEAKEKKGLAFLLSSKTTTCGLCIRATEESFKRLRQHSVVVYLDTKDEWRLKTSPIVKATFDEKTYQYIPKVVVTSPDSTEVWGRLPYKQMKDSDSFRELDKQVDALAKNPNAARPEQPSKIFWFLKGSPGRGYRGTFESLEGETLKIKDEKGKIIEKPLSDFEENIRTYATSLAGKSDPSPSIGGTSSPTSHFLEDWTGTNGKVIQATFVSLQGDVVQLRGPMGQLYSFPLSRLNEASQAKAQSKSR